MALRTARRSRPLDARCRTRAGQHVAAGVDRQAPRLSALTVHRGEVVLELGCRRELALLATLTRNGSYQLRHSDVALLVRGEEAGGERDVADLSARQRELAGEELVV